MYTQPHSSSFLGQTNLKHFLTKKSLGLRKDYCKLQQWAFLIETGCWIDCKNGLLWSLLEKGRRYDWRYTQSETQSVQNDRLPGFTFL